MAKNISTQIAKLEEQLAKKRAEQLNELQSKLKTARAVVSDLEAQMTTITGRPSPLGKRKRTNPAQVREMILGTLEKNQNGLTQKEIADHVKLPYGSVVQWLKNHPKEFKVTGKRKQKRYFSK